MKENEDFITVKFYSKVYTIPLSVYTYYHQPEEKRIPIYDGSSKYINKIEILDEIINDSYYIWRRIFFSEIQFGPKCERYRIECDLFNFNSENVTNKDYIFNKYGSLPKSNFFYF